MQKWKNRLRDIFNHVSFAYFGWCFKETPSRGVQRHTSVRTRVGTALADGELRHYALAFALTKAFERFRRAVHFAKRIRRPRARSPIVGTRSQLAWRREIQQIVYDRVRSHAGDIPAKAAAPPFHPSSRLELPIPIRHAKIAISRRTLA